MHAGQPIGTWLLLTAQLCHGNQRGILLWRIPTAGHQNRSWRLLLKPNGPLPAPNVPASLSKLGFFTPCSIGRNSKSSEAGLLSASLVAATPVKRAIPHLGYSPLRLDTSCRSCVPQQRINGHKLYFRIACGDEPSTLSSLPPHNTFGPVVLHQGLETTVGASPWKVTKAATGH